MKRADAMSRRGFLAVGAAGLASVAGRFAQRPLYEDGSAVGVAAAFDSEINAFMRARAIPGGALVVVKDRRLVYAQGYGWADREKKISVTPKSLFRIASLSKPFTAVAVLKLVEERKLTLDDRAFDIVRATPLLVNGRQIDPRLSRITVRQLLQHVGGWDREKSFDPMFRPQPIAAAAGTPSPAKPDAIIRYMLGLPLDFDPGQRYAYSNFGYCVLGRIIETVSAKSYERYVRESVLMPAGIKDMHLGATLDGRQAAGEVRYYTKDAGLADNVFDEGERHVPWPYGGFNLEAMDAHGGWIASAVDLARFAAALDDPSRSPLLKPETLRMMHAPPPPPAWRSASGDLADAYYGCGWMVRPHAASGRANYWHSGSLPGTSSLLVRRWDGLSWAVLFNQRSEDPELPDSAIDPALHRAAAAVNNWPKHDGFGRL